MISADNLLSSLGLQYGGRAQDLQGSPAKIVANLIALTEAFDAGTYETAKFITSPVSSATFDPKNVAKETALMAAYRDALASGNVNKVHKAVDAVNKLRMVKSGGELTPMSDFEIVAHQQSQLGDAARWIVNFDVENGNPVGDFFDQFGAAIRKYAKASAKK